MTRLGIEQLKITPRSPWQNGDAERWVGTLRREPLDHVIVLGERHLLRLVRQHAAYDNKDRPGRASGSGCGTELLARYLRMSCPIVAPPWEHSGGLERKREDSRSWRKRWEVEHLDEKTSRYT